MWGRLRLRWTKMFVITQSQDGNCKCHKTGEKVTGGTGVMVLFCSSTAPHTHIWISLMTCRSEGSSSRARTEQSKYHHCFIQIYFYISILYYTIQLYIIREVRRWKLSLDHISAVWFVSLQISLNCRERRAWRMFIASIHHNYRAD